MTKQKKPFLQKVRQSNKILPFYTMNEMRNFLGYKSLITTRKFLIKCGVPIQMIGKCYYVFLSDLQNYSPELFASILEANSLNTQLIKNDFDQEQYTPNQFK